jgi:hypothetical protein
MNDKFYPVVLVAKTHELVIGIDTDTYCIVQIPNRAKLLQCVEEFIEVAEKNNLGISLSEGWVWEFVEFEGQGFRNSTPNYRIFIYTKPDKYVDVPTLRNKLDSISDTTDKLADIGLFNLLPSPRGFGSYEKKYNGMELTFFNQELAKAFVTSKPINRRMTVDKRNVFIFYKEDKQ